MARMVVDLRVTGCWRHRVGEHHGRAKFADSLVDQVLELHERGLSQRAIVELTGVPRRTLRGYIEGSRRGTAPDVQVAVVGQPRELRGRVQIAEEQIAAASKTSPAPRPRAAPAPTQEVAPARRPERHALDAIVHAWAGVGAQVRVSERE